MVISGSTIVKFDGGPIADGLSHFDGYSFTNFGTDQGLPHRLWAGTCEHQKLSEQHWGRVAPGFKSGTRRDDTC